MRRGRSAAAGALVAAAAAALLFGDLLLPDPASAPPPSGGAPLAELLPLLPARNVGRFGKEGDPLNLLFLGSQEQVAGALSEAGWTRIPARIPASIRAGAVELLREGTFRAFPPMNLYRLEGRFQDFNWAKPITLIAKRHHFRLWRALRRDEHGRELWWGSGNLDVGFRWWSLSHVPDPDMNAERAFIKATLESSRWVESLRLVSAPQVPAEGVNDKGHPFRTDGRVLVAALKPAGAPAPCEGRSEADCSPPCEFRNSYPGSDDLPRCRGPAAPPAGRPSSVGLVRP